MSLYCPKCKTAPPRGVTEVEEVFAGRGLECNWCWTWVECDVHTASPVDCGCDHDTEEASA